MADIYNKFQLGDLFQSTVQTTPQITVASGTGGWRGSTGPSASLSLYGGVRSRTNVKSSDFAVSGLSIYPLDPLDTHSIDKVIMVSGSYPSTGSIRMVKVRATEYPSFTQVDPENWYQEHFSPIEGLFDYYSKFNDNFFTGSYDFYSMYLSQNARYSASAVWFSGSTLDALSTAMTFEAHVKPVRVTSSFQDFTIMSQKSRWKLFITGSTGQLVFSDFASSVTSSAAVPVGQWNHVSAIVGNGSASLYVGLQSVGTVAYTGSLLAIAGGLTGSHLVVGAEHVMFPGPRPDNGFRGFLYETRIWNSVKSNVQLSSSADSTIASGSSGLLHYARFNDGPLSVRHGFSMGSGTFDHSQTAIHGQFQNIRSVLPAAPIWQPNDDRYFTTFKTKITDERNMFKVVHVPSMFYGRQIATGSIVLTCNGYSGQGIVRTLRDDGRGGLYVSGSLTKDIAGEDFRGVCWNKVGNVFYTEGLVVITDPSLLDFGEAAMDFDTAKTDQLQISFKGLSKTHVKTFSCRANSSELNCSRNPSFSRADDNGTADDTSDDRYLMRDETQTTWITSIAICNEENRIVAIAKLAQPIRKRPEDKINIRLRMDF